MSRSWQLKLAHGVSEFDTGTSDIEDRHHHCSQMAPEGSSVELMSARYVLAEAETLHDTYHTPLENRLDIPEKKHAITSAVSRKRLPALMLFHCKLSRDNMARRSHGFAPQPNYFRGGMVAHTHSQYIRYSFDSTVGGWGVSPTGKSFRVVRACARSLYP